MLATPNPSTKLVELGQTKAFSPIDDDRRSIGDIDTDLDHGSCHENVKLAITEGNHHLIFFPWKHASMEQGNAQIGKDF